MPNTNSAIRRIEAGGVVTINNGTLLTLVLLEPGTLKWVNGWYEPLEYTDRGVLQTPMEGDERPGQLEFEVKYTGGQDASDVEKFFRTRTATGLMQMFTVIVKLPNNKLAVAGQQATFSNCFLIPDGLELVPGAQFDRIRVRMKFNAVEPSWTTY